MYRRFVAIGDGQTEGVGDGERRGHRGWADRLAERLAQLTPDLEYANLAVRGQPCRQVRAEQLDAALRMDPDVATVVAGLNDVVRPGDPDAIAADLDAMIGALAGSGARVATLTYPDIGEIAPLARRFRPRLATLNERVRETAHRHGAVLVETDRHPVCADRRIWSADRLHLNPLGHARLAAGFAQALELPGSDDSWTYPLPELRAVSLPRFVADELRWAGSFLAPRAWRRLTGRSSGGDRGAKRPQPRPLLEP